MKIPIGSLWRFRELREPVMFEVTKLAEQDRGVGPVVSYRTVKDVGHEEESTSMPLTQFLRDFERLPDPVVPPA